MVDLDLVPGQLGSAASMAGGHAGGGDGGGSWAVPEPEPPAEAFPSLPQAAPPRPPVVIARPPPRPPPTAAAAGAAGDPASTRSARSAADSARAAEKAERNARLRAAFGRDAAGPSSFAAEATVQFSAEALAAARSQPKWVEGIEQILANFIAGDKRRESLQPMPKPQRAIVHELAKVYGIATGSYDDGPRRHVDLFRTANVFLPGVRLSDAAKASPAAAAAAAAAALAAAFEIN